MLKIELVPDCTHCIEMAAKKGHAAVLKQILAPREGSKELKEKLEILRLFLETADFKQLRSESEKQLMERRKVRFVVYLEDGTPKYEMQVI